MPGSYYDTYFRPLIVTLINWATFDHSGSELHLEPHERVIRPLFDASREAYVYKGTDHITSRGEIWRKAIDLRAEGILEPARGKFAFDKGQECITGHELLWNAGHGQRGSIVLILDHDHDFSEVFRHCYRPGVLNNPGGGESPGAIRLCKRTRQEGGVAVTFSRNNGIDHMLVYAPDDIFDGIYDLAERLCGDRDAWHDDPCQVMDVETGLRMDPDAIPGGKCSRCYRWSVRPNADGLCPRCAEASASH